MARPTTHARRAGALGVGADPSRAGPLRVRDELDWVAKLTLLNSYRDRDGLAWSDAKLTSSTCSTPTCAPRRGSTTGS